MEGTSTTTTADAISPSLDDTVPMVHRLETVEVSTDVLNAALRHGSSGLVLLMMDLMMKKRRVSKTAYILMEARNTSPRMLPPLRGRDLRP